MGWCHEFGPQILPTCDHPMVAGPDACSCPECNTVCKGRFGGCTNVWARGPRTVNVRVLPSQEPVRRSRATSTIDTTLAADAVATVEEVLLDKLAEHPVPSTARSRRLDQQRLEEHALDERRDDRRPFDDNPADEPSREMVEHLFDKVRQLEATVATTATAAAAAKAPPAAPADDRTVAVVTQLVDKVRRLETAAAAAAAAAKAPRPATAPGRPPDNARVEAVAKAVGGLAAGLDRLTAEVSELRKIPGRLEELEQQRTATTGTTPEADGNADEAVERLTGDLARLSTKVGELTAATGTDRPATGDQVTELAERVKELESGLARSEAAQRARPVPAGSNLTAMVQRLEQRGEQLSARFAPLESLPDQVRALEAAARAADTQLADRVERLASQVEGLGREAAARATDTQLADRVEQLASQVEDLASAVQSGRSTAPVGPVQQGRANAIEKVVGELLCSTERLSARVGELDEVPKRLQALEAVEHPPVDKVLASLGKRLDRLSTQVGDLKSVPDRLRALEEEPRPVESLTRGLGGAIDMIDQLSAQVTAIQEADRAGN